ncbi:MAG: fused MFS/spermidine synthase [Bacteroidales bacterium]|nr:fused MFS/spermidine synthase [Bacteroidales bacterium]
MKALIDYWKYINSFFTEQHVDSRSTEINPTLEVSYINGRLMLNAEKSNYSYGNLHRAFQTVFREIDFSTELPKDVLILGFGAGSVASIIVHEYGKQCYITGVEKDKVVIDLARRHFLLSKFKNLDILIADAYDFMMDNKRQFDLVVFDVYKDQDIPIKFETTEFLEKLIESLREHGFLIFNKFIHNDQTHKEAETLMQFYRKKKGTVQFIKTESHLNNGMIVYRKT